jgi:hypothetical protein
MWLTVSGWIVSLLSLIVNTLQLLKNADLKKQLSKATLTATNSLNPTQQTHSGTGSNISIQVDGVINGK